MAVIAATAAGELMLEMGVTGEMAAVAAEYASGAAGFMSDPIAAVTSRWVAGRVAASEGVSYLGMSSTAAGEVVGLYGGALARNGLAGVSSPMAALGSMDLYSWEWQFGARLGAGIGRNLPYLFIGKGVSWVLHATNAELHAAIEEHLRENDPEISAEEVAEIVQEIINRIRSANRHSIIKKITQEHNEFNSMAPWPKTRKQVLRWCSNKGSIQTTGVDDGVARQVVKLNDLNNPGSALAISDNHEPLAFSQMAAVYDQYVVSNVNIRVDWFLNEQVGANVNGAIDGAVVGLSLKDDTTALTVAGHYQELDGSQWIVLGPEQTGRQTFTVKPNRFFGIPDKQIKSDPSIRVMTDGTPPTNLLYLHLWAHEIDPQRSTSSEVDFLITVEYEVTFMEPKDIAQTS